MRKIKKPIGVKRRGKKLVAKLTRQEQRRLKQMQREHKLKLALERQRNDGLIVLLTHFIQGHYGDPATGKRGAIITGPVGARLTHASSLRALLIENEPVPS